LSSFSICYGTAEISLPFAKVSLSSLSSAENKYKNSNIVKVSAMLFSWVTYFGKKTNLHHYSMAILTSGNHPLSLTELLSRYIKKLVRSGIRADRCGVFSSQNLHAASMYNCAVFLGGHVSHGYKNLSSQH